MCIRFASWLTKGFLVYCTKGAWFEGAIYQLSRFKMFFLQFVDKIQPNFQLTATIGLFRLSFSQFCHR